MGHRKFVKPGEGRTLTIRDAANAEKTVPGVALPGGAIVPAAGVEVDDTLFVRRRLRDGDLVEASAPATKKTTTEKSED
ncbi:DUF2635 domain-containing protein [Martelella endophytica]|uniref:Uncharacterized protein n=1 Tax=Martelella endophytica TaxID=1486262 RepID=A0A0D5LSZ6_MAREN|nr:DUF2635 domain-containing protein [Martelella endophytica]AJY46483.1 hypothetical protein TM49_13620 [Martelella endophytica]